MISGRLQGVDVRLASLVWAFLAAFALPTSASAQHLATASPSQLDVPQGDTSRTKFIVGLERHVEVQVSSLTSPNRVIIELPDVKLQLPVLAGDAPVGLIKSIRGGLSAPGKARIVIDVTAPVIVERTTIEKAADGKSARLALDIVAAQSEDGRAASVKRAVMHSAAAGLGAIGLQPPMPRPALSPQARAAGIYKPIIVIDPGHGGDDTGATKFGTVEKNVVLAFALKLRDKLQATGRYKVLLTRETDVFIPLEDRREFAERNLASLFIAVHADYTGRASARGATIYSLREAVANSLQRSAKGEVAENVLSGRELAVVKKIDGDAGTVKGILADLAQREVEMTKERTSAFTRSVIEFMGETTNLMDNPDRSAAFVVLKTAKVPSVLIELGFVTNETDAAQLKSDKWREKVSGSIMTAIENYFSHQLARLPM